MITKNAKRISLALFFISTLLVYSCRENPKTEEKATTTQTESTTPGEKKNTPGKTTENVALNPAHGQPGHRCDISVGAPLNSKPAPVKTNSQSSDVFIDNSSSATKLPKGTPNPAHGQPGHVCSVKVGEPL